MEKKIQFLVRQWKGEHTDSQASEDAGHPDLERELETIWRHTANYKTRSFEPDLENNWQQFQSRIRQEDSTATPVRVLWPRRWLSVAAVLGIGLTAWFLLTSKPDPAEFNVVSTDSRHIKKFELPDHSVVWLSNNSELSYDPQLATASVRSIRLRGEAFFQVKPQGQGPLQVETPHGIIEVMGTSFNVRALQAEPQTEVQVMAGRVALLQKNQSGQSRIEIPAQHIGYLAANQPGRRIPLNGKEKVFSSTEVWRTRKIDLSGRPLAEAQEIMRRYSKYRLEFADPRLADCIFTWTLQLDSPETSLQLLAQIGYFRLEKTSADVFRLVGRACP